MKPIEQDKERFAKLAPDKPSSIPRDFSAPLDFKPTRTLIAEREAVYPDGGLPKQVHPFEECFSMWTAIKRHFFPNQ